jgi:hypothetical protein
MAELDHGPVRFDASDVSPAVALLRTHSTSSDDITAWIDIRPLDVPAERLPTKKGLLGRSKSADPPSAQIIWVDPSSGRGDSTINIDLPGVEVAPVIAAAGPAPAGWKVEDAKKSIIVTADVGVVLEQLVSYAVGVLSTALGGWQGGFEAEGVDVAEYGRRIHGM